MENRKVMIVNDIAGIGKVSSNVMSPILSAANLEPIILPTLLLSSNTEAGNMVTQSTNAIFTKFLNHWDELDFSFDAFITGYFAEITQISQFREYFLKKKQQDAEKKLFVDPSMADDGQLYLGFNEDVPKKIGELIQHADIVKLNVTEACLLTGHSYREDMPIEEITQLAEKVRQIGAKNTIITGIKCTDRSGKKKIGFLYYDEKNKSGLIMHDYFEKNFFGTGDIVFALITSFYLSGRPLEETLEETAGLIEQILENTLAIKRDIRYGVYFESILPQLHDKLYSDDPI